MSKYIMKLSNLLIIIIISQLVPTKSESVSLSQVFQAAVGDDTELFCNFTSDVGSSVDWTHYSADTSKPVYWKTINVNGHVNEDYSTRFKTFVNSSIGIYYLQIKNVQPQDAGTFKCNDERIVYLVVLWKGVQCSTDVSSETILSNSCDGRTDTIQLKCIADFLSSVTEVQPELKWISPTGETMNSSKQIVSLNSVYQSRQRISLVSTVSPATDDVFGVYSCETASPGSTKYSCSVVPFSKRAKYFIQDTVKTVDVCTSKTVTCEANTNIPSCNYSWFYNDTEMISSDRQLKEYLHGSGDYSCAVDCEFRGVKCSSNPLVVHFTEQLHDTTQSPHILYLLWVSFAATLILVTVSVVQCIALLIFRKKGRCRKIYDNVQPDEMRPLIPEKKSKKASKIFTGEHGPVWGLTVFNDLLYVVFHEYHCVGVFDINSFKQLSSIVIKNLKTPEDIAACKTNRVLYITDSAKSCVLFDMEKCVWKIDPHKGEPKQLITQIKPPYTLSVTTKGDIVMLCIPSSLVIYNHQGKQIKEIKFALQDNTKLRHAVFNENTKKYIICHGSLKSKFKGVLEIAENGKPTDRFYNFKIEGIEKKEPRYMAIDDEGRMYLADHGLHRIVCVNQDFTVVEVIAHPEDGIMWPFRIHYDQERGKIFIGQTDIHVSTIKSFKVGAEHHLYRSAEHGPVWGIAVLNSHIYVVCYEYNQVLVYQVSDFKQLESISMLELDHPQDMAACIVYNCLFIADSAKASAIPDNKCVWKLNLNDPGNPVRFIKDLVFPNTLSVTPDCDILMVQQGAPLTLKLFDGNNGNRKVDITLPNEIQIPRHAVYNKKSRAYIVCHGSLNCDNFGVCAINSSGTILSRYAPLQENLIRVPWHLACDSEGNIYIAGHRSHKILKLSSSLEYIHTVAYKADGVFFPLRIHYHDETENLFVGQWRGDALVIDGKIKPARKNQHHSESSSSGCSTGNNA